MEGVDGASGTLSEGEGAHSQAKDSTTTAFAEPLKVDWDRDAEAVWAPHFNQCTKRFQAVLLPKSGDPGSLEITTMLWGLIPPYAQKGADPKLSTINARIETLVANKAGLYTRALQAGRRCVVVCSGFFEWKRSDEYDDKKWPFYIRDTREIDAATEPGAVATVPLLLAGLFQPANDEKSQPASVTVVTLPAGRRFEEVHDRQPAVLTSAAARAWLDTKRVPAGEAVALLERTCRELPPEVQWYPVRKDVGQIKANGAHLLDETPPPTKRATERKHGAAFMDKWVRSGSGSPAKRPRLEPQHHMPPKPHEAPEVEPSKTSEMQVEAPAATLPPPTLACPACTFENVGGAIVCSVCASPLAPPASSFVACPQCTLHNAPDAPACVACAGTLQGVASSPSVSIT